MEHFIDKIFDCMCDGAEITYTITGCGFDTSCVESKIDTIVERDSILQIGFEGGKSLLNIDSNAVHNYEEIDESFKFIMNDVMFSFILD